MSHEPGRPEQPSAGGNGADPRADRGMPSLFRGGVGRTALLRQVRLANRGGDPYLLQLRCAGRPAGGVLHGLRGPARHGQRPIHPYRRCGGGDGPRFATLEVHDPSSGRPGPSPPDDAGARKTGGPSVRPPAGDGPVSGRNESRWWSVVATVALVALLLLTAFIGYGTAGLGPFGALGSKAPSAPAENWSEIVSVSVNFQYAPGVPHFLSVGPGECAYENCPVMMSWPSSDGGGRVDWSGTLNLAFLDNGSQRVGDSASVSSISSEPAGVTGIDGPLVLLPYSVIQWTPVIVSFPTVHETYVVDVTVQVT
jgi:hypothetical protein